MLEKVTSHIPPTMTAAVRTLILSHVTVFAAGFAAGKYVNADELNTYREIHENSFTRFKRKAGTLGLAVVAVGTIAILLRVSRGASKSPS